MFRFPTKSPIIVFTYLLLLLFPLDLNAQDTDSLINKILQSRKRFDIEKAEKYVSYIKNEKLKKLFIADLYYQKSGLIVENEYDVNNFSKLKTNVIAKYLYGDLIKNRSKHNDSLVFQSYLDAFKLAEQLEDTLLINIILPKINQHLLRNGKALSTFLKYIRLSKQYAKDSIDYYRFYYYRAGFEMRYNEFNDKEPNRPLYDSIFKKGLSYAISPYFVGYMQQFKGIYYDAYLKKPELALELYDKAIVNYKKDSLFYSHKGLQSIAFNKAIIYYQKEEYNKSINFFRKHELIETEPVYLMYNYEWLYKNYDKLKIHDSAYFYFKKMIAVKDELSSLGHLIEIKDIESRYNLIEKEKEFINLTASNRGLFEKNKALILFIISLIIAALLLVLLLKKQTKQTGILEEEKAKTLVKIEELKDIVTKDFIVLKDKTKVYISELMYIKSDDHYLKVHLSDGSNNFVRGILNKINDELPPNFVRCHRSYIVNQNYIKQLNSSFIILNDSTEIPLSRSYKDKIKLM